MRTPSCHKAQKTFVVKMILKFARKRFQPNYCDADPRFWTVLFTAVVKREFSANNALLNLMAVELMPIKHQISIKTS